MAMRAGEWGEIRNGLKPGGTLVVVDRPGGELEEVAKVFVAMTRHELLTKEYEHMEQKTLEAEYRRIYSNFDLSMTSGDRLRAILGVLVSKYGFVSEDLQRLRGS